MGNFQVEEVKSFNGFTVNTILSYSACLEQNSNHPIAKCIVDYAFDNGCSFNNSISDIEEISGKGLKAIIDNRKVIIGNKTLLNDCQIPDDNIVVDNNSIYVSIDGKLSGIIRLADRIKDEAIDTFIEKVGEAYLKKIGYAADFYVVEIGDGPCKL